MGKLNKHQRQTLETHYRNDGLVDECVEKRNQKKPQPKLEPRVIVPNVEMYRIGGLLVQRPRKAIVGVASNLHIHF